MKLVVVSAQAGVSRGGNPYRRVTLHDPKTLENSDLFLPEDAKVDLAKIKHRDVVECTFEQRLRYGRMSAELVDMKVIGQA